MLPAPKALLSGVATPLPGSSTGLVAAPLYCGEPSVSRAMVVANQLDVPDLLGADP